MKTKLKVIQHLAIVSCLLALAMLQPSCRALAPGGVYNGDKVLYEAESTIKTSYQLVDTFVRWEETNRELLTAYPKVSEFANKMRDEFPAWYDSANNLRDAYVAAPGGDTEAHLRRALKVLRTALVEAAGYMATSTKQP